MAAQADFYGVSTSYRPPEPDEHLQNFAATTIQRYWRGFRCRRWFLQYKAYYAAQHQEWHVQQQAWDAVNSAALTIQKAWEGYRNKRIYRYYRDLIQFRERGDPKDLLKSINPREAQLADAAAGIHVRFRLGGSTFPPLLFYKIFTHRPVTDICAFCPRDYANEVAVAPKEIHNKAQPPLQPPPQVQAKRSEAEQQRQRQRAAKQKAEAEFGLDESLRQYIKPDGTLGWRTTKGWYERHENNGWRPINDRILVEEDPVTTLTRLKRMPLFHFDPAVRREDKMRVAKQKKREWMIRMYQQGSIRADSMANPEAAARLKAAADRLSAQAAGLGDGRAGLGLNPDHDLDEDLDIDDLDPLAEDLLNWTEHLDFDTYLADWTSMACTLGTEAFVPELEGPSLIDAPPPSHDLRGAMAAAGVPLQPCKQGTTPASGSTSYMPLRQ